MKQIKLSNLSLYLAEGSISREKISDELYFSHVYKRFTSNSRLKWINPKDPESSPKLYFNPPSIKTKSLLLGSAVHEQILQPGEFFIPESLGRPTEKLGDTIEKIKFYRKQGYSIYNAIVRAAKDCDYYVNNIDSKISMIIQKGFSYYWKSRNLPDNAILLPDKDRETCLRCIKSIEKNKKINNKLHPVDIFGDLIPSFNEDAFFADFIVVMDNKAVIIPFKMKIDNWTIDIENKVLTLNDLKTSRKCCKYFMHPEFGSWTTFCYNRQFGAYSYVLKHFCEKEYGFNEEWKFESNVFVVETTGEHKSECFCVPNSEIEKGFQEFENLMKMVGYYTIFGYDEEVEFI